jgi:hypothetical protein
MHLKKYWDHDRWVTYYWWNSRSNNDNTVIMYQTSILCCTEVFFITFVFHVLPTKQFYNYLSIHLCLDKYLTKIIVVATKRCVEKRLKIPEGVILEWWRFQKTSNRFFCQLHMWHFTSFSWSSDLCHIFMRCDSQLL